MRSFKGLPIASCVLALSAGVAFANDLHFYSGAPGQTGSNVLSSCSPTSPPTLGNGLNGMTPAKTTTGIGSPFDPSATKKYAGNPGNNATNPKAVSQYDNACAQAQLHQMP